MRISCFRYVKLFDGMPCPLTDISFKAACVLANLANGHEKHQGLILSHPKVLVALRSCLAECKSEIRRPAIGCIKELVINNPRKHKVIIDAGIVSTLRHISEWSGALSPGGRSLQGHHSVAMDDDRDILEQARQALDCLEHGAMSGDMLPG